MHPQLSQPSWTLYIMIKQTSDIYINDISVYSKCAEEHPQHLKYVLERLRDNLYANWIMNIFPSLEMEFLGHVLSEEKVKTNPKKIQLIKKWQSLVIAKGVRSFLRLANFYRKFIKDFFALAKLLTDLFKK